jgi:sphingomyelin phosphodiesterase acid-like 3
MEEGHATHVGENIMKPFSLRKFKNLCTLTAFCLAFLLISPLGCGKKTEQADIKEPVKAEAPTPAGEAVKPIGDVGHISDIHFNPFYDPSLSEQLIKADPADWEAIFKTSKVTGFGVVGTNETNYPLFVSSLQNMAQTANKPDFIVFTGDFIAHEFQDKFKANSQPGDDYKTFIDKVFTFISAMFKKHFPETPVYFCLGNNDSYSGDYKLIANGAFLHKSAEILSGNFLKNQANKDSFALTYPVGGYYKVAPNGSNNTQVIAINSIFFSTKHPNPTIDDPAKKELVWLEEQFKSARQNKQKIWLINHIPPGANVYSTYKDKVWKPMWQEAYNTQFIQLLEAYAPEITAGFLGHTHMDDWRLLMDSANPKEALVFFHISPAISPQFGNNPGYQHMTYNRQEFGLLDYKAFYLDLEIKDPASAQWQHEYTFSKAYHQIAINPTTLLTVYKSIKANPHAKQNYMNFYDASNLAQPELNDDNFKAYWCGIGNWTKDTFNNCYPPTPAETKK